MNNGPLSPTGCVDAIKKLLELGLDFSLGPVGSTPWAGTVWHSKFTDADQSYGLAQVYNVFGRGRRDPTGTFRAFGISAVNDSFLQTPFNETPAYKYLREFGTLSFDAGMSYTVVFKHDPFVTVSETQGPECIQAGPLAKAKLTVDTGFVCYGAVQEFGRFSTVTSHGDALLNLRDFPELLDTLKRGGRVRTTSDGVYAGSPDAIVGPQAFWRVLT